MPKHFKYGPFETKYTGRLISVKERDAIYPDGQKIRFEYCERPDSVTILPFDKKGRLLMMREFRYRTNSREWFVPAGRVDKGENIRHAAVRELREEAGVAAKKLVKVYTRKSGSNLMLWNIHVFVALGLYSAPLKGDEHFDIQVVPVSLKKAVRMAISGEITSEFISYHIIRINDMIKKGDIKISV
jgi:ADP-ribose pyrophosphatase